EVRLQQQTAVLTPAHGEVERPNVRLVSDVHVAGPSRRTPAGRSPWWRRVDPRRSSEYRALDSDDRGTHPLRDPSRVVPVRLALLRAVQHERAVLADGYTAGRRPVEPAQQPLLTATEITGQDQAA